MKLQVVSAAYASWLFAIEVVFFLVHGQDVSSLEYVAIAGVLPVLLQLFLLGVNPFGLVLPMRMAMAFLLIVLLSFLYNGAQGLAITYTLELLFLFGVAIVVAGCPDPRLLRTMAVIFCIPNAAFLLYVDMTGRYLFGRLVEHGMEPNWWGMMAAWLALSAFAFRSRVIGASCIAVGFLTIYFASARGSLLGVLAAIALIAGIYIAKLRGPFLVAALGGVTALLIVGAVLSSHYDILMIQNAANDVLKLDDPYRGLGQGFSGRSGLWEESIDLWRNSPLFGVGFRQHESYLPGHYNAHNAYLAMMADTGIAGLLWYLLFIGLSLSAALRLPDQRTRDTTAAIILGYAVIGLFERRAINGGNPLSIYLMMCCFYALAQHQWRSALAGTEILGRPVENGVFASVDAPQGRQPAK